MIKLSLILVGLGLVVVGQHHILAHHRAKNLRSTTLIPSLPGLSETSVRRARSSQVIENSKTIKISKETIGWVSEGKELLLSKNMKWADEIDSIQYIKYPVETNEYRNCRKYKNTCYLRNQSGYFWSHPIPISNPYTCHQKDCEIISHRNYSFHWSYPTNKPVNKLRWSQLIGINHPHVIPYNDSVKLDKSITLKFPGPLTVQMYFKPRLWAINTTEEIRGYDDDGFFLIHHYYLTTIPIKLPNGYIDGIYGYNIL